MEEVRRSKTKKMAEVHETVPPNGRLIYTETVLIAGGKKKEISIDFDLSLLDNKFHVEDEDSVCEIKKNAICRIKLLIKLIEAYNCEEGKERSFISFVMSPDDVPSEVDKLLEDRVKESKYKAMYPYAEGAIRSAQQILKQYNKVPPNGFAFYTGIVFIDDNRQKEVTIKFEPLKLIYMATRRIIDRFDIMELIRLVEPEPIYGFIVMVDNRALIGRLSGNKKKVLCEFAEPPPVRVLSLAETKRRLQLFYERYFRKVVHLAETYYFDVSALVVAASTIDKTTLTNRLCPHLKKKIMCVGKVSLGGKLGFDEAIRLSSKHLNNVRYIEEIRLLQKVMEEINQGTKKYVSGVENTLKYLDMDAVAILILCENLDTTTTSELITKHLNKEFKCTLEFVTDSSPEGSKFFKDFGMIVGILKDKVDIQP